MSFDEALAAQPQWIRIWLLWMGVVLLASMVLLLFSRTTRRDSLVIFLANFAVYVSMNWLFQQLGYVRLLGIIHVVFWTPLAVYLWLRLKNPAILFPFRQMIWLLLITITISLAFDYVDVVRYLLGEQGSMIGEEASSYAPMSSSIQTGT